jgi:HK97 family phage major capsid protein
MAKIFIKIDDTDAPEIKAGKELMNNAFNALDTDTQKSLETYQKGVKDQYDAVLQKSTELEKSLADYKTAAEAQGKSLNDQVEEMKTALKEMNLAKVETEKAKRKSFADSIAEGLDGKQAQVNEFLSNKSSGRSFELKAAGNMGVGVGAVAPLYTPIVGPAHELIHARNYIPVSSTISNLIRYVRFTNKDGAVGIALINSLKPQFDYTETIVDAPVIKIAGWINVADEFLEDIVGAASFLSTDLTMKLYDAEDSQVFKGDGTTGNLSGLYTNATALSLPYAGVLSTANNIDKLAAAATYVRRQKRLTTAAWTSPEDYLNILINKASGSGEYTYPVRFNALNNQLMIGDFPVIQHTVFNPGEGFVGDFATGARIFQKADATLRFSTENVDNFVKNVTTVLVEERIALADFYPESFVKVALNGTYSG